MNTKLNGFSFARNAKATWHPKSIVFTKEFAKESARLTVSVGHSFIFSIVVLFSFFFCLLLLHSSFCTKYLGIVCLVKVALEMVFLVCLKRAADLLRLNCFRYCYYSYYWLICCLLIGGWYNGTSELRQQQAGERERERERNKYAMICLTPKLLAQRSETQVCLLKNSHIFWWMNILFCPQQWTSTNWHRINIESVINQFVCWMVIVARNQLFPSQHRSCQNSWSFFFHNWNTTEFNVEQSNEFRVFFFFLLLALWTDVRSMWHSWKVTERMCEFHGKFVLDATFEWPNTQHLRIATKAAALENTANKSVEYAVQRTMSKFDERERALIGFMVLSLFWPKPHKSTEHFKYGSYFVCEKSVPRCVCLMNSFFFLRADFPTFSQTFGFRPIRHAHFFWRMPYVNYRWRETISNHYIICFD